MQSSPQTCAHGKMMVLNSKNLQDPFGQSSLQFLSVRASGFSVLEEVTFQVG
jgi:hypothetical protein